ncbi:hypothetical protein KJE20_14097 [Pyrenophora tritici-repentis]|nr:hypothetical protein KJE20_14097 [Pyrenophora tritici-repentis]
MGEVNLPLSTPSGIKTTTLKRVALIQSFFTSLVSLSRLSSSDIHFDSGRNILYRAVNDAREDVASLTRLGGHWLVVHRTHLHQSNLLNMQPLQPINAGLNIQLNLSNLDDVIDHLAENVQGIQQPPTGCAPRTIDCEVCSQNKAHQIISRRMGHEIGASRPFETVAIDIIKLDVIGYNGHRYIFHAFDLYTKFNFVYSILKRDKETLLEVITRLDRTIKREFNTTVTFIIADDERGYGLTDDSARAYCQQEESDSKSGLHIRKSRTALQKDQARL